MKKLYYKVACHTFVLETNVKDIANSEMQQYEAFQTEPTEDTIFSLEIVDIPLVTTDFQKICARKTTGSLSLPAICRQANPTSSSGSARSALRCSW